MPEKQTIHIIPAGFEYDRIIAPILREYPAKKVYVLQGKTMSSYPDAGELEEHFVQKLKEQPIPIQIEDVNIYHFDEVFERACSIINKEITAGNTISINISAAPHLALVALLSAALLYHNIGKIKIIYVAPEKYLLPEILNKLSTLKAWDGELDPLLQQLTNLIEQFRTFGSARGVKEIFCITFSNPITLRNRGGDSRNLGREKTS